MKHFAQMASGLLVMAAAVVATVWIAVRVLKNSEDPGRLLYKWVLTAMGVGCWIYLGVKAGTAGWGGAFFIAGAAAAIGIVLGILWAPHIGAMVASPLTGFYNGGSAEIEPWAFYSIAQANRKKGRHAEAIAEARRQLEKFPTDYQGWMLIAEIQAEDLKQLPAALATIEELLTLPDLTPKNLAYALNQAADWQLKFAKDRGAAEAALQRIAVLLPDTEQAQLAAQRIAHLATQEQITEHHQPRVIALKQSHERIGLSGRVVEAPPLEDPALAAGRMVKHLELHPLDNEVRERLATVYAEHYHRLDLAAQELERLIATPHQQQKQVVHWLNLLADFQVRSTGGVEEARGTLQRIIDQFPQSAAAANAETRLSQLKLELKQHTTTRVIKMGTYEQNVGLKNGRPR